MCKVNVFSLNLSDTYLLNPIPAWQEAATAFVVVAAGFGCQLPNQFQLQPITQSDGRPASRDKEQLAGGVSTAERGKHCDSVPEGHGDAVTAAQFRQDVRIERKPFV